MNLLLDSHTLLWLMEGKANLSREAMDLIADAKNALHLRMASVWEIGIKVGLRKLGLSVPISTFFTTAITGYSLIVLPITVDDCVWYEALVFPDSGHRDPFDRERKRCQEPMLYSTSSSPKARTDRGIA